MDENKQLVREAMRLFYTHYEQGKQIERRGGFGFGRLPGHPFDLPLLRERLPPLGSTSIMWTNTETDLSCAAIALHLGHIVEDPHLRFGLRIIKTRIRGGRHIEHPGEACHDYFFELATNLFTIIAGACNDHSGNGNQGRRTLDTIFRGFSQLYEQPIEEFVFSIAEGERARAGVMHWLEQVA